MPKLQSHENNEGQNEGSCPEEGVHYGVSVGCVPWAVGVRQLQGLGTLEPWLGGRTRQAQLCSGAVVTALLVTRAEARCGNREAGDRDGDPTRGWGSVLKAQVQGGAGRQGRWTMLVSPLCGRHCDDLSALPVPGGPRVLEGRSLRRVPSPESTELESDCQRPPPGQWDSSVAA